MAAAAEAAGRKKQGKADEAAFRERERERERDRDREREKEDVVGSGAVLDMYTNEL